MANFFVKDPDFSYRLALSRLFSYGWKRDWNVRGGCFSASLEEMHKNQRRYWRSIIEVGKQKDRDFLPLQTFNL